VTIPTIAQIRDQILSDIDSQTGQTAPRLPRSVWWVLATALAGALRLLYQFGLWAYRQIFTATMDEEALIRRGAEYGLTRTPAQKWRGTVTATGTDGTVISSGTLWTFGDFVYTTEASVEITSGTAVLTLEALEAGEGSDLSVADTVTIVSPQTGVDKEATVASVTQAGEDAENLEDYRTRILARQQNQPQGGAIPDWILWATEVAGIAEATIERPDAGEVNIYPITDDPDPANRIPGGAKLTEVETYVTDPVRSPIRAAAVTVVAPTEITFDVEIANLSPNTPDTKTAIEDAIEAYMYARRPDQYDDIVDSIATVSQSDVTAIARDAGADVATVTLKNAGGSSITSYTLDESELAVLGSVTWV